MGVSIRTTRVAAATGGGNQDITITDFGTPKAALFFVTSATANATKTSDLILSVGATDGTTHAVASSNCEDGQATSDSDSRGATDEVILIPDLAGGIDGEANFNSWITDGVRITWGNAPASAYLITVVLFTGSDLSVDVGTFDTSATDNTGTDVGCGFEPDVVFLYTHRMGATGFDDTSYADHSIGVGFADNDSGSAPFPQYCWAQTDDNGLSASRVSGGAWNDRAGANMEVNSTTPRNTVEITDFYAGPTPAAGFEATSRDIAAGTSEQHSYAYLALAFGGAVSHKVGDEVAEQDTGSQAYTDAGFTPQFALHLQTNADSYATNTAQTYAGLGIAVWDATNQYTVAISNRDNESTTVSNSQVDTAAFHACSSSGNDEYIASFTSFDTNGWTVNFTDAAGNASLIPYLAIQEESAGAQTVTQDAVATATVAANDATITVGAVTTTQDAVAASTASANDATITTGSVSVTQDAAAALSASANDATITVGAVTTTQDAVVSLTATANDATASTTSAGAQTVTQDAVATISASAFDSTITVGAVTTTQDAVAASSLAANDATISATVTTTQDAVAAGTVTANDATITVGAVTVTQDATASLTAASYTAAITGGTILDTMTPVAPYAPTLNPAAPYAPTLNPQAR